MQTIKQEAISTISKLPDDATMDDIMYRLYVIDKINKGRKAILNGKFVSHEELKREITTW
jgi:predicted transcriptional regulator